MTLGMTGVADFKLGPGSFALEPAVVKSSILGRFRSSTDPRVNVGTWVVGFISDSHKYNMPCPFTGHKLVCGGPILFVRTKLIYILCQSQTFGARPKDDLCLVNSVLCSTSAKTFGVVLNAIQFLVWQKPMGIKTFWACRRTRQ
jgi:hypothetical protein